MSNFKFNDRQLSALLMVAQECQDGGLGELSVADSLVDCADFNRSAFDTVRFLAEECERQGSGPMSVYWMATAFNFASRVADEGRALTVSDVITLLQLVEPEVNKRGYRCVPVTFANGNRIGWQNIERQIPSLLSAQDVLNPLEFYTEFEKIHPGTDGNGRVGAILYNHFGGTLNSPVAPPMVDFS